VRLATAYMGRCQQLRRHPALDRYRTAGEVPESTRVYLDSVREALESGSAVVVETWPAWSVLTGWNADITALPFVTVPGFRATVAALGLYGDWGAYRERWARPEFRGAVSEHLTAAAATQDKAALALQSLAASF
jgi:hypothetical protein